MALSPEAFFASSNPLISQRRRVQQSFNDQNLLDLTAKPLAQLKWSFHFDHTLLSTSMKHINHESTIKYPALMDNICYEHGDKIKMFKHVMRKERDPVESLNMIDAIQRLAIDYHFEEEIGAILQRHFAESITHEADHSYSDLHEVSLRFRLLRQQGYYVPSDVFEGFIDSKRNISEIWCKDIRGLIGIYEASQLSIEGETILDEAGDSSTKCLNSWVEANPDSHQAIQLVRNTLGYPLHKNLPKFTAKSFFMRDSHGTDTWIDVLQDVAKVDFNMIQAIHQEEIVEISKWWSDMGLAKRLKFARDQPLKWYLWSLACMPNPSFSEQRVELTKPISLIYLIDDIFDVYGTLEELTLFAEAINRWDFNATEKLPEYMKICFRALDDITNEISIKVYEKHGYNPLHSLRLSWGRLCNAFLVEARWFASNQSPKAEEYLENGLVSSGVHTVLVHLFFLLGEVLSKESVDLVNRNPSIITSVASILRLWDDLGSAKDENQEGQDGSYIDYYMKEHRQASIEATKGLVMDKISESWKRLNKECLSPNPFPPSFTKSALNLARMVPLMYSYDENQRLPKLEELIKSVLYESVPL